MNPEPDDEMPAEYDFDYSKAKSNRFTYPNNPLTDVARAQAQLRILELFGTIDYDEDWDYKAQRKR